MPYGLSDKEVQKIKEVLIHNNSIEKAILYGSRAKGNFKPFSDIDLTLVGEKLSRNDLCHILTEIDDLLLPYQFDISLFHSLKNEALIQHIERVGIEIYKKQTTSPAK